MLNNLLGYSMLVNMSAITAGIITSQMDMGHYRYINNTVISSAQNGLRQVSV